MMYVYFKAVGLNYASTRKAMLAMESELFEMGIFDLADSCFRFNTHYIGIAVSKRNLARFFTKVNNSRLFLCSHVDGELYFTYAIS